MSNSKIVISPRVDRDLYFKFRNLCHAHGVTVGRGIEEAIRAALARAGLNEKEHDGPFPNSSG